MSLGNPAKGMLAAAVLAAAALFAAPASAEIKNLEIIAPANAGGGYDQHARAMQQVLQEHKLASSVQVVNIPGAGGTIGLSQFVTAKKRNPGLMISGLGMIGAILINKSPVSLDQVTPLARLTGEYQPIVVAADSPLKTLDDLVKKFKADPGSVSWGGFAVGSPDHILYGLLVKAIGGDVSKMNYIAAGAGGEMMASVLGGHITVATGGYNEMASQLQAGKLRALAISAPQRLPGIDVPTFKEQGVDVELVNWRAVMAPGNLKASEKQVLDDAVGAMVRTDDWKRIAAERGWIDLYLPPDQFAAFVKDERTRIEGVLTELGLVK
ncbi:tripartite tricarboxylate transporter substrate binding protein [Azospirillum brasilense]|uniref:Tripartite tricarboxylate transporter substrate binding protein n=1 Tax=Azospirillum brasilense TaxID=192 RepID=A0A0N7I967_AZOBR|nr:MULTISPECIES: tripartite tricarboxylate transporter substrate binding protein [Azospirillum]ALJ39243.1 C4-dicarboxylate ABC transporter substrate-binding protein [Azospirillum brasilense]MDW7556906.1 tripartite tricarboxylate transporter substrate binding protein [Azospirillum brasilense]MDW7596675.1 tripartite tricarboxylate transporter substrate binding protein [Azospirillum brasilense]MDW7631556.1 tripartite tricarboxylate transporter substrate binding protein [Azospirillum brasilense]MD